MKIRTLILDVDHTDAGRQYKAEERIEVDALTAEWMIGNGIAHAVTGIKNTQPKEKEHG